MIEIEKPAIECLEKNEDGSYGKFVIEPLERGYGMTLGNSLGVSCYPLYQEPRLLQSEWKMYSTNFQRSRA